MKNIYQDDSFNKDSNGDVFSKTSNDFVSEFNLNAPEKPKKLADSDSLEAKPAPKEKKAVHSAKQAPPPIKKTSAGSPSAQLSGEPFAQAPYFQQPIYYPNDPNQPYPVFVAPNQTYPVYPQPAYPVQPMPYQPVQPGYIQPTFYPQAPVMPTAAQPFPVPQDNPVLPTQNQQPPISYEAGTRVLFQSADFDNPDETSPEEKYSYAPAPFSPTANLDITEIELPSRKRAGGTASYSPSSFKVDEMEIGTYELNAMSLNRSVKVTGVDAPVSDKSSQAPTNAPIYEEADELYDESTEEKNETADTPSDTVAAKPIDEKGNKSTEKNSGKKKLSGNEIARRIVLCISIALIAVSIAMLYKEYRLHKDNENNMSSISDLIITEESSTAPTAPTTESDSQNSAQQTTTKQTTTKYLTPSEQFELLKKQNPDINFPQNIQYKYAKLYAENPDFVGYLSAKGTDIDFPIVQGVDDEEYLETNFFGEYTKYGCPFMTSRNNVEPLDMNTIIYGHHMRDGSLFATLDHYTTLEGFKEAPIISFNTIYHDYDFKVFAVMITNIDPKDDNGYVFPYFWTNLNTALNYTSYLNQLAQRSLYDTGVDVLPTDRILTLSTCYSEFTDARLVVVARLVRPGESTEVDTSKAVENPNPRYPQAYYDKHKLTNPYANAYKWEIT